MLDADAGKDCHGTREGGSQGRRRGRTEAATAAVGDRSGRRSGSAGWTDQPSTTGGRRGQGWTAAQPNRADLEPCRDRRDDRLPRRCRQRVQQSWTSSSGGAVRITLSGG